MTTVIGGGKYTTWLCVALLFSCLFADINARKLSGSSSKSKSRPSGSGSRTHTSHTASSSSSSSSSHADAAKLSYAGYNSAPNPPRTVHQPSAPAMPHAAAPAAKPIGWNVPANTNTGAIQKQNVGHVNSAAPSYPAQGAPAGQAAYQPAKTFGQQQSTYPGQAAAYPAPPAYSPHGAPPPAYSPHANAGPPPAYSQYPAGGYPASAGHGYPAGGYHAPAAGGYPAQQPGGYPAQQNGGYPAQPAYVQQPAAGQPVVNNYYQNPGQQMPQKSGGNGLQTALIAGVGGLALYGALKPSEQKTIIIHEADKTVPAAVTATPAAVTNSAPAVASPAPAPAAYPQPAPPGYYPPQYQGYPPIDPNTGLPYPQYAQPMQPGQPAPIDPATGLPYGQPGQQQPWQQPGAMQPGQPMIAAAGPPGPLIDPATGQPVPVAPTTPLMPQTPINPADPVTAVPPVILADGQVPLAPFPNAEPNAPLAAFPTLAPCPADFVPLAGQTITCALPSTTGVTTPPGASTSSIAIKDLNSAIPVASNSNQHLAQTAAHGTASTNAFSVFTCLVPVLLLALRMA